MRHRPHAHHKKPKVCAICKLPVEECARIFHAVEAAQLEIGRLRGIIADAGLCDFCGGPFKGAK